MHDRRDISPTEQKTTVMNQVQEQPKVHKPKVGAGQMQPALFKNPILEKLSRTHISIPLAIFAIISATVAYYGITEVGLPASRVATFYVVGFFFFTLVEYLAHRFVYHMEPDKKWKEELAYKFHGVHHDYPKDKTRLALPPIVSIIIASALFGIFYLVMGVNAFGFLPGLLTGYATYLGVHYIVHAYRPPNNFFKALWVNHGVHHYKHSDKAFGVSSPLWDYVFRTMPPKARG
ncbi:MAG: sterol desaturase/sphingolipid hydroxylase (fatty acid hydroxylase superfamily) [Arenicella sp.]